MARKAKSIEHNGIIYTAKMLGKRAKRERSWGFRMLRAVEEGIYTMDEVLEIADKNKPKSRRMPYKLEYILEEEGPGGKIIRTPHDVESVMRITGLQRAAAAVRLRKVIKGIWKPESLLEPPRSGKAEKRQRAPNGKYSSLGSRMDAERKDNWRRLREAAYGGNSNDWLYR